MLWSLKKKKNDHNLPLDYYPQVEDFFYCTDGEAMANMSGLAIHFIY